MKVFCEYQDQEKQLLMTDQLRGCLGELGYTPSLPEMMRLGCDAKDFDSFVAVCDMCRRKVVAESRKKAGYTDEEVEAFKQIYEFYDKDKSGEIDMTELLAILARQNLAPKNKEEQQAMMKKLDQARAATREAGITNVNPDGSTEISFWVFVQLSRLLQTEHDRAHESYMANLTGELRFSGAEVDQFRQIFRRCVQEELNEGGGDPQAKDSISRDAIKRLVVGLGMYINPDNKRKLEAKLKEMESQMQKNGLFDFEAFLRLMRWLMDVDFAGINSRLAKG